jgi:hypothetical protein
MKRDRFKHNFFNRLSLKESWVIFFVLGVIMLNYPFLHIFNKITMIMNIPLLFFYIFYGWGISILVIFLFTRSIKPDNGRQNSSSEK